MVVPIGGAGVHCPRLEGNGSIGSRGESIAVRSIGTHSPEGPEPTGIAGYRGRGCPRQLESVCDRMLLRRVHVFRVREGSARMLRRSGCEVGRLVRR